MLPGRQRRPPEGDAIAMHNPPTGQHEPTKSKHRRRWPWITGAAVLAFFVLVGIFGNKPQTTGSPTVGTVATASATSSAPTTTPTTTVYTPITTTTVAAVVAPPPIVAPPPVVVEPPVAAPPPVEPPAPVTGKYHAGEFCKTVGATAISTTGAPMTCLQEGKSKRWHND